MNLVNHALSVAIGVILGAAVVWWVRPDSPGGAAFIVVVSTLICFTVGAIATLLSRPSMRGGSDSEGDKP